MGDRLFDGERPCADGVGRYVDFTNGSIYWHPELNVVDGIARAIAVPAHVYATWSGLRWEQGTLGYPVARHEVIDGVGDVQRFQGASSAGATSRRGRSCTARSSNAGKRWEACTAATAGR
ncbi:hypothetical protein GTA09_21410 [Rhodococcus hoagii]|nr:hypothetical protein [Prescottella equi]